ncbi:MULTISPECIES: NACHT domain-containing protein [Sorangium]|uniref:NACHT domain-containing protein n=1 Tax=Sorangium TaxID=39643 RepID=UPI003D9C1F52
MPAPGGPTNQSGVGYQNAIAALYLGRLCDATPRPPSEIVREVRIETHGSVDDIEVAFGNEARRWMQAKERITTSSSEWKALWIAFQEKRREINVERGDRLELWLGMASKPQEELREAARRAQGARTYVEWRSDLSKDQRDAVESVEAILGTQGDHAASFDFLRGVRIEIASRESLTDRVPSWIPRARDASQYALYDLLQTRASEGARYRKIFTRSELLTTLRGLGFEVLEPVAGEGTYRDAIQRKTATMSIAGTSLHGATENVFRTPRMRLWRRPSELPGGRARIDPRDLDDVAVDEGGEPVRLEELPSGPGDRVVVTAGAGAGKSTLLDALAHRLSKSAWLPAVVRLVELANHGGSVIAFLDERTNRRYATSIAWTDLCEEGTALVLFDGLDELPQHLRSKVLDEIDAFSARFPKVPWIMTVRDMAGTAAPPGARIIELQPLSPDDVEAFCRGWLPPDRAPLALEIARKVSISREVRRMARIPFLLALMVERAAASPDGALPTRRSELLEQYVGVLLRPEKRKPGLPPDFDASTLRAAAEALAFAALDAGETDIPASSATVAVGGPTPQGVLDALVARGLLREGRGERYAFVFPILQECLAGHYIASKHRDEIVRRFETEASRPWTQALQFALEVSDQAEVLVTDLLAGPDDAFRTKLKILGRCVANGARVSPATRARLGDELAARWVEENRDGRWTGQLIADAFAKSLPAVARQRLCEGEQLYFGGADIVVAAEKPDLTEAVLRAILRVKIPGHVNTWQSAIDAIAPTAARMYLERAAAVKSPNSESELHWIAYLLGRVADVRSEDDPRVAYANDASGDPLLRLACLVRLGTPLTDAAEPLVIASFRRYVATEPANKSPMFDLILDTLFRLPRTRDVWRSCLDLLETTPLYAKPGAWWLNGLSPSETYWRTVVFAVVGRTINEEATALVRELAAAAGLPTTRRDYLDLVLAYLGDEDAFDCLAHRLETLYRRDLTSWVYCASHRPASAVGPALPRLRHVSVADRLEIAQSLGFAFSYDVEMMGLGGVARGRTPRRHPAAGEAVKLLKAWADDATAGSPERFGCFAQAVNLGAKDVAPALLRELVDRLSPPLDFNTDHRMADALSAVVNAGVAIPLDVLVRAASLSNHNLGLRAMDELERLRRVEALDALFALHAAAKTSDRKQNVAGRIERLARALAVRVVGDPSGQLSRRS